jgi:hypothetical protein
LRRTFRQKENLRGFERIRFAFWIRDSEEEKNGTMRQGCEHKHGRKQEVDAMPYGPVKNERSVFQC